jgi:hypothetical protein
LDSCQTVTPTLPCRLRRYLLGALHGGLPSLLPEGWNRFTVNLRNRKSRLLTEHIGTYVTPSSPSNGENPFTLMPALSFAEHLHCIWTYPETIAISPPDGGT